MYIRKLDDKQVMQLALIENVQRQDLSPIEEARAYRQLMDEYKTNEDLLDNMSKVSPREAKYYDY